jgi:hypothetical protein
MALSPLTTWTNGQVLTHTALNAEFANIYNNANSLISPLTANLDAGGFRLQNVAVGNGASPGINFNGSANTGFYSSGTGVVDISCAGGAIAEFSATSLDMRGIVRANSIATTGAGAFDHILTNSGAYRFIDTAGVTSVNYGMSANASDGLTFSVPAVGGSHNFNWAGSIYGWMQVQNSGMGLLFAAESSADHAAPGANQAVIYSIDVGGKTALVARFPTGAVQQFAIEP